MHYRGLLRVARRDSGTRVYAPRESGSGPAAQVFGESAVSERIDTLVDLIVRKYAPLPAKSLAQLLRHLRAVSRSGRRTGRRLSSARSGASRTPASMASSGTGRPRNRRPRAAIGPYPR